MWILQSRRGGPALELSLFDDARAAWVAKGARKRRALQVPGWLLTVITEEMNFRPYSVTPAGHATFGRHMFHRLPRGAFWERGPWDYRQPPYDAGWGLAGQIDPNTGAFEPLWSNKEWFAAHATEDDLVALDTMLEAYLRGAPPDGVYNVDALRARANPRRRRVARRARRR